MIEKGKEKGRNVVPYKCDYCGIHYQRSKDWLLYACFRNSNKLTYCTNDCSFLARRSIDRDRVCLHCKIHFIAKSKEQLFCNQSCSAKYNNKKRGAPSQETKNKISKALSGRIKTERKPVPCIVCGELFLCKPNRKRKTCSDECYSVRLKEIGRMGGIAASQSPNMKRGRSRSEIYFAQLIQEKFNNVLTNKRMFDGWDADVILLDLKIAIHWNGPCHYLPLFGDDYLQVVQNKDRERYAAIEKCGYTNYIIDDRDNQGLTKSKVRKEFNIFKEKYA